MFYIFHLNCTVHLRGRYSHLHFDDGDSGLKETDLHKITHLINELFLSSAESYPLSDVVEP